MGTFLDSLKDEEYVTLPPMKRFINKHIECQIPTKREECLARITEFSQESSESKKTVDAWLDETIKAGIKFVRMAPFVSGADSKIGSRAEAMAALETANPEPVSLRVARIRGSFDLIDYSCEDGVEDGLLISLVFARKLVQYDVASGQDGILLTYPVFVDVFTGKGIVVVRSKPKSNLYDSTEIHLDPALASGKKLTLKTIHEKVCSASLGILGIKLYQGDNSPTYHSKLYALLERYTFTPVPIVEKLESNRSVLLDVSDTLREKFDLETDVPQNIMFEDIRNMMEKYVSVHWTDKEVFVSDRRGFPVKLKAKDEEDSSVEQYSARREPLQSKLVFFENKRMLEKNKCCENMGFFFKRKDRAHYPKPEFSVKISAGAEYYEIAFREYTEEEDIRDVLFEIAGFVNRLQP